MARRLDPTPPYVRPNSVHPDFVAGRQYTMVSPPRSIALGDPDMIPGRSLSASDWNEGQALDTGEESDEVESPGG